MSGGLVRHYDNALAGMINGVCKAEVIHRPLLKPIGNIPPAEAEERDYAVLKAQHMAASHARNSLR